MGPKSKILFVAWTFLLSFILNILTFIFLGLDLGWQTYSDQSGLNFLVLPLFILAFAFYLIGFIFLFKKSPHPKWLWSYSIIGSIPFLLGYAAPIGIINIVFLSNNEVKKLFDN